MTAKTYHGHTQTIGNSDLDALWATASAAALASAAATQQWGPTKSVGAFTGRNYTYNGGTAIVNGGAVQVAGGSLTLNDNAVSYVERTYAGVVSANIAGFTTGLIAMAKVTVAGGVITAIEDWRPMLGPFPYYPLLVGEVGAVDLRYPVGDTRRTAPVGDGVADDLAKLQATIDALTAGDEMTSPRTNMKVSGTLNLNKKLKWRGIAVGEGGGVAAVSGTKITGSGFTLVRMTESAILEDLCITDPTGNAATVALDINDGATGVVNWVLRNPYLTGQFAKLGTGLRCIFALKGKVDGGVIEGWNVGVDLQASTASLSNANHFSGTKIRVNTIGLKTTAIDDVFLDGCTLEGNGTDIKHESGKLNVAKTHFEASQGLVRNIHITGGNLVSMGNGFYSVGGVDKDIYVESGNGAHLSVGDTFARGIKHNGTGIVLVINPVNGTPSVSGTGPVVMMTPNGITGLQGMTGQALAFSGFAYIATALALLNTGGSAAIGGSGGTNLVNGSNTTVAWVSALGALYPQNSGGGPGIFSGAGSPEGVQTAPVGALYLRNNGGAVTSIYVKESGAGNTGWVAK